MKKAKRIAKKAPQGRDIKRPNQSKPPKGELCERYNGVDMCYRCLDLARSLLLCEELDPQELKKIKKIMTDIVKRRGVLKEDVVFLGNLSDAYLN